MAQPQPIRHASPEIPGHDIAGIGHRKKRDATIPGLQIDRYRPFVPIEGVERRAFLANESPDHGHRPSPPALAMPFDLQNDGTRVRTRLRARPTEHHLRDVRDPDAIKDTRHVGHSGVLPRIARKQSSSQMIKRVTIQNLTLKQKKDPKSKLDWKGIADIATMAEIARKVGVSQWVVSRVPTRTEPSGSAKKRGHASKTR